jgi:hypothetical protein
MGKESALAQKTLLAQLQQQQQQQHKRLKYAIFAATFFIGTALFYIDKQTMMSMSLLFPALLCFGLAIKK